MRCKGGCDSGRIFKVLQHAHSPTMRYRKVLRCCGAMFYTAPHRTHLVAGGERYTRHFRILSCRNCNSPLERSEEHTSELQSLMRISYAVFCLKKKKNNTIQTIHTHKL